MKARADNENRDATKIIQSWNSN